MSKISSIHAREILDSRGNPTVEVEVSTHADAWESLKCPQEPLLESTKL